MSVETDPLIALATIQKLKPEILFLDIEMPKLNGFELLSELTEPLLFAEQIELRMQN